MPRIDGSASRDVVANRRVCPSGDQPRHAARSGSVRGDDSVNGAVNLRASNSVAQR